MYATIDIARCFCIFVPENMNMQHQIYVFSIFVCQKYEYATDSFTNPVTETYGDTTYAADSYSCPYNVSSETYPLCDASAASQSIYLDENVPVDDYDLCPVAWIGDGLCYVTKSVSGMRMSFNLNQTQVMTVAV